MTPRELYGAKLDLASRATAPCFMAFIYSIYRLFRTGFVDSQGFLILIASIFAFFGTAVYFSHVGYRGGKSWMAMTSALSGFLPYILGCYLVFYKGFWSFTYLGHGFSWRGLLGPILWILVGYRIVKYIHLLSELHESIHKGEITITPDGSQISTPTGPGPD